MKKITFNRWRTPLKSLGMFALILSYFALGSTQVMAQCTAATSTFGTATAPAVGASVTVTTCAFINERATLNSMVSGNSYTITYSAGTDVTIFDATLTAVGWGTNPYIFTPTSAGSYFSQVNQTACGTGTAGCVTLTVLNSTVITCPKPDTIVATSITSSTASLGWIEQGTATSWNVEYGAAGFAIGTGTDTIMSINPLPITGLSPGTNYDYYVRAICTAGDTSFLSNVGSFTTPCLFQLSGIYTVDPGSAITATNYGSVSDVVNDLNICGVSGAVIVNVLPNTGPYTEVWNINTIPGASASNTITLNGNGNVINRNNASTNHFVRLDGVKHLTINDFDFVNQTPATAMFGIQMKNGTDSISITNNLVNVGTGYTTSLSAGIVASNSNTSATSYGNNANNVTITGNEVIGGYYGVIMNGTSSSVFTSGHTISNNNIHDFYYYGIRTYYAVDVSIVGNDLHRDNRAVTGTCYGIYARYSTNTKIKNNKVHSLGSSTSSCYPIYVYNSVNASQALSTDIINNAIYDIQTTGTIYGIYLSSTRDYINVFNNTVDMSTGGTGTRRGIYMTGTNDNHKIWNNIFSITGTGTGTKHGIYRSTSSTSLTLDYNVVYVNAGGTANHYGYWGSNESTLADWQTATTQAANSVWSNPVFANPAGGDFAPLSLNVDNVGQTLSDVPMDIQGVTRSLTTPDVGAIEFTGIAGDMEMTNASLARVSNCYGSADSAFAQVTNILGSTVDFSVNPLTVYWTVTGPVNTIDSLVVSSGTMAVNADSIFSISSIDMSLVGDYMVSAHISANTVNASALNDSLFNVYSETVVPILASSPDSITITSPYDSTELTSASPLFPAGAFLITERCQFAGSSTGRPASGKPAFMGSCDDYIEITGVPGSSLEGITYELWTGTTKRITHTFGASDILGPNGTAMLGTYNGANSPSDFFYIVPLSSDYSTGSSTSSGHILKDASGNIMDALAYGSQTFSASSGVTASDWSGSGVAGSGSWGIRLTGADMNDNTGWVKATQDPNTLNAGVPLPVAGSLSGLAWDSAGVTIDTIPNVFVGPFTTTGVYPFTVTFASACGTYVDSAVVTVDLTNAAITAQANVNCFTGSDGTATVTAGGGDAPYTYLWSNGETTATAVSLTVGTHTVTVYDANTWPATASVTLTEPSSLVAGTMSSIASPCGVAQGTASVVASGGTAPYTYLWSDGATTAVNAGIVGGPYTVTVSDNNGCTFIGAEMVSDSNAPVISFTVTKTVTCYGGSDGEMMVTGVGGTLPFSYNWANGDATATATGLDFGTHAVTLTDGAGCLVYGSSNTTSNPQLIAVVNNSTDPLCNGDTTGTANALGTGGIAPYTFAWSNGEMVANASNLGAGAHNVSVTDDKGCMSTSTVNISQPNQLEAVFVNVMDVACNTGTSGSSGALATGGVAPYSYAWSNGNSGNMASALAAGYVTVSVTDANNCMMNDSVQIMEPAALVASTSGAVDALCYGGSSGSANASAAGGTLPYVYAWSNGAGGMIASGLSAGSYTVSVNDANNCLSTSTIAVGEPLAAISAAMTINDVSCNGLTDGDATAVVSGGTAAYSYAWSTGGTSAMESGMSAGSYMLSITDANGCMNSSVVVVGEPIVLTTTNFVTNTTCYGSSNGQILANSQGGVAPYTYLWNNGVSIGYNGNVEAGVHTYVATDANGCEVNGSATVTENDEITFNFGGAAILCNNDSVELDAGSGFVSYLWSDSSMNATFTISSANLMLGANMISVSVVDADGCMASDSVEITLNDTVAASIFGMDELCADGTGSLDAGPGYYSYQWSNMSFSQLINVYGSNLSAGTHAYSVTVTDIDGCEGFATNDVEIHPAVIVTLPADTMVWQNPVFTIMADSGYASYAWNTGAMTQNLDVTSSGVYTVVVTDSVSGCEGSDEIMVEFVLGVNTSEVAQLKLYPNPAVDFINLEFSNFVQAGNVEVEILSITGQLVRKVSVDVSASNGTELIDVSHLAVGTYMVTFNYDNQRVVKQFTIK